MALAGTLWACFLIVYCGVEAARHRYVARVAYDGTHFSGWQAQQSPTIRTVQSTLSECLTQRLQRFNRPINVVGASRTDVGVHARGQAMHFDLFDDEALSDLETLQFSLNRMLPKDVRIFNLSLASSFCPSFHCTASAIGKKYVYRFCNAAIVDPLQQRYCAHLHRPANLDTFHETLQLFIGRHNFSAFANKGEQLLRTGDAGDRFIDPIRTISSIHLVEQGKGYFRVEIHVQSALYKMLRNVLGTAYAAAQRLVSIDQVRQWLREGGRRSTNPAMPVPSQGLELEHVYYEQY